MRYEFHELANIFPLIEGEDFAALVEDIRQNGLVSPIILHGGKIIDGRNRYRACIAAGVEPEFSEFQGDAEECRRLVVSENLRRRHMNESQRALVAARLAGGGKVAMKVVESAADTMNVSPRSVTDARVVLNEAPKPIVEAVERGEMSVSRAASEVRQLRDAKGGRPRGNARVNQLYRGVSELRDLCDVQNANEVVRHWPCEPGRALELRRVVKALTHILDQIEEVERVAATPQAANS